MRVLFFLSVLACSGCSIEKVDPSKSAEFRFVARDIYNDLLSPSCDAPSGFSRHDLLRSELDAVSKFERQLKGTEPGNQLAIARQDFQYSQRTGKGCWNDDGLTFAKLHVDMTKKTVRNGLGTLRRLRPDLGSESDSLLTGSDDQSAFRYHVSLLVQMVSPMCDLHIERKNDELLTPAKREVDRFKQTLAGTSYAAHYAIAKEDVAYKQSITSVECAERSDQPPNLVSAAALADAKKQIAAVARTMKD